MRPIKNLCLRTRSDFVEITPSGVWLADKHGLKFVAFREYLNFSCSDAADLFDCDLLYSRSLYELVTAIAKDDSEEDPCSSEEPVTMQ